MVSSSTARSCVLHADVHAAASLPDAAGDFTGGVDGGPRRPRRRRPVSRCRDEGRRPDRTGRQGRQASAPDRPDGLSRTPSSASSFLSPAAGRRDSDPLPMDSAPYAAMHLRHAAWTPGRRPGSVLVPRRARTSVESPLTDSSQEAADLGPNAGTELRLLPFPTVRQDLAARGVLRGRPGRRLRPRGLTGRPWPRDQQMAPIPVNAGGGLPAALPNDGHAVPPQGSVDVAPNGSNDLRPY
jgi:hypothetical protein